MKLQNDDEEEYSNLGIKMPTIILAASAAIFVVLAIVLIANGAGSKKKVNPIFQNNKNNQETVEPEQTSSGLTAQDLNFWDMYKNDDETLMSQELQSNTTRKDQLEQREADMRKAEEDAAMEAAKEAEQNIDPATDGKHTLVKHPDGSTEWITINSSIGLNNFDDTQFQSKNGILGYYSNGKIVSKTGADISQYTTQIDWTRLSTEVDYVMIRVGARGYDSGKIIADVKFADNVKAAYKAGIPFGVYFSSQATDAKEAEEEAAYCLTQLSYVSQAIANESISQTNNNNTNSNSNTNTNNNNTTNTNNANTTTDANGVTTTIDANGNTISTYKDASGNTVSKWVYPNGNSVTSVTGTDGKVISTTVVTADENGNITTSVTDENGNTTSTTVTAGQSTVTPSTTTTQTNPATPITNTVQQFKVSYPIAIDMHMVANDKSRIETLTNQERTTVLTTFCDAIKRAGYSSMICGTKEFMICKTNLAAMSNYEKWIANEGNLPDYPYNMSMWKYNTGGTLLKSLSGDYSVDVSFIDYTMR